MLRYLALVLTGTPLITHPQTLTQKQTCKNLSSAIVSIDAGGASRGTGFLVSSDGYILTASHVVRNGPVYYSAIDIALSNGAHVMAVPAIAITAENYGQDYALLKIAAPRPLPFLTLGSTTDVELGADGTIIGYPFSAVGATGQSVSTKFCLSATFAAVSKETRTFEGTQTLGGRSAPLTRAIPVDVIYFQGISVKGLSGSPVIARDTGHVFGILSTKLTGITVNLEKVHNQIVAGSRYGYSTTMGVNELAVLDELITTLDNQLANGMGSAVGIDEAQRDLDRLQRSNRRTR